jgi:hypothetical protein
VFDSVALGVLGAVPVPEMEAVCVEVMVTEGVWVTRAVLEVVFERVAVRVCVMVGEGLGVQLGVDVCNAVILGLAVKEELIVLVRVTVGDAVFNAV